MQVPEQADPSMPATHAPVTGAPAHSVRAPLLTRVIADINPEQRIFLIDLGGLQSQTLSRFEAFRCRIDVLDLDIEELKSDDHAPGSLQLRLTRRLPESLGESADLMLCWNYLNYFSPVEIDAMMQVLLQRMSKRSQIHALIESSATQMPRLPLPLSIAAGGSLSWAPQSSSNDRIPTPRHSSDGLLRCLPGFSIDQTMLLANGQREFLFFRR